MNSVRREEFMALVILSHTLHVCRNALKILSKSNGVALLVVPGYKISIGGLQVGGVMEEPQLDQKSYPVLRFLLLFVKLIDC